MSRHGRAAPGCKLGGTIRVRRFARAEGLQFDNAGKQQRMVLFEQTCGVQFT